MLVRIEENLRRTTRSECRQSNGFRVSLTCSCGMLFAVNKVIQSLNVRQEKRLVTEANFFCFFRFGVERPKLPLGQTLNHAYG